MPLKLSFRGRLRVLFIVIINCLLSLNKVNCQVLNPPYFNLAEGRNISATSTCGENVPEPELYCKLVGSNWLDKPENVHVNLIQGQACDYCDPNDPLRSHPAQNAIDGTERWWQSPPLSRGAKYNEVNLTMDLGQEFNVAYVFIKMGNSPRPGVWALERSRDYGKTYTPWQYFADTPGDCVFYFQHAFLGPPTRDDSVICETRFSKIVPLEGGEIAVSLLNGRPNADNFSISATLQEWSTATNIRLRLLRPKTTLGHLLSVARQDPTVTRRYFYSIKDINIGGRCVCNGHAAQCDQIHPTDPYRVSCSCQHNTCGSQCEQCCSGYTQHKWRRRTIDNPYVCEKCNCYNHSDDCYYDQEVQNKRLSIDINGRYYGGGVCVNCQHNTEGINCNKCKPGFFRPRNKPIDAIDVCQACQCDLHFSTGNCSEGTGQCECKINFLPPLCNRCSYGYFDYPRCIECHCFPNGTYGNVCELTTGNCPCREGYSGKYCKQCSEEYFGFPNCQLCDCDVTHSVDNICDSENGQCNCRNNFGGRKCDQCDVGFYDYPRCQFCACDQTGSTIDICSNITGECFCKEGYSGSRCDICSEGYFGFPNCTKCMCDQIGSFGQICDNYGKCICKQNFGGLKCSDCSPGFYKYPDCLPCACDYRGSNGVSCDYNGRCVCLNRFEGEKCDKCREGYYNFPRCEECNCNPAGLVAQFGGCDKVQEGKLCECKDRVEGRICNQCKDLYWNLQINNPLGCEDCFCNRNGTIGAIGLCDGMSGQCICKQNVKGRRCDACKDETYSLSALNVFGCNDCNCDIGGSVHSVCNKTGGQCFCKPRIKGQRCTEPIDVTYFPTLYQFQFEAEDWRNPTGSPARFAYEERVFPGYSWRGYATFTDLQREILTNITMQKPSIYRAIIRYINLNNEPVSGTLSFTPAESFGETQQNSVISFEPTRDPKFLYVAGKPGLPVPPLVLNAGQWEVSLKVDKNDLLVDYITLLPQAYFDPTLFQDRNNFACKLIAENMCQHYSYPKLPEESVIVRGQSGFVDDGDARTKTKVFSDEEILKILNADGNLALIDSEQTKLILDMSVDNADTYALIILYHNPSLETIINEDSIALDLEIKGPTGELIKSSNILIPYCNYMFICRQVITDKTGQISMFEFDTNSVQLTFKLPDDMPDNYELAIDSIVAIPYLSNWSIDYLTPKYVCLKKDNECIDSSFSIVPEATKIEFEKDQNKEYISKKYPFETKDSQDNLPQLIYLNELDSKIDVRGNVAEAGLYRFILHYYQPDNPNFDLEVLIQNGHFHDGVISVEHCPSRTGCRAIVRSRETNSSEFEIDQSFMLTVKQSKKNSIWIDYILVVPSEHYDSAVLNLKSPSRTNDFLSKCGQNTFYTNIDEVDDFCYASIFSITIDFNGGALPCQCNTDGSYDYKCKPFGGQCNCKPNVIGRTCSRCKTGYYGFPTCRQCNCPSTAVCHQITGECICPRGVTGDLCNKCLPLTFGFDPIIGCVDCDCQPYGIQNRDLQCDVETGQCNCKRNVVGRTCNKCKSGFWSFPFCQLCRCDIRGTTDDICDQSNSRCFCKENVFGDYCDQCNPDAYYLEESNALGCTKCFCFGTTDRCTSSSLKTTQILAMDEEWRIANLLFTEKHMQASFIDEEIAKLEYVGGKVMVNDLDSLHGDASNFILYFVPPKQYLGNRITSYGGNLKYLIHNTIVETEEATGLVAADLVLSGSNITIIHEHVEQPTMDEPFEFTTKLVEREFRHLNGHEVTREQMMMVLVKLDAIYIRGTYFEPITQLYINNVLLDNPIEGRRVSNAPRALSVEQCNCPPNYKGTSCEECATGYYRARTGPYLGFCLPCQCNGHSTECDVVTGQCFNCKDHTEGEHCEKCITGFHGNATRGTPYDCLICACPLPIDTNNFATSCEVTPNGLEISCNCVEGYYGARCDSCGAGFYGRPEVIGSTCQPCNCHGNIDPTNPGSCESTTGECIQCLNNTTGRACELCKLGFYGDAISEKNCSECSCDACGTERCDQYSGTCQCKTNVVNRECNQCQTNHWGFSTCRGCRPCNCEIAAEGKSCDDLNGQCKCRTGVTGLTCNKCEVGFWKYSPFGCTSCKCIEKYSYGAVCDQQTGQCQCLPGVVGDKCDSCPHRWVFIPKTGCRDCGPCVHVLLDDTDELTRLIDPLQNEMKDTSTSMFAYRRLSNVNKTLTNSETRIQLMSETPTSVDFSDVDLNAQKMEDESNILQNKNDQQLKDVARITVEASSLKEDASMVDSLISDAIVKSGLIVEDLKQLEEGFHLASALIGQNIERKIADSEYILQELNGKNFEIEKIQNNSMIEFGEASDLLERISNFRMPSTLTKDQINSTLNNVINLIKLLSELMNRSQDALRIIVKAEEMNKITENHHLNQNLKLIKSNTDEVIETLRKAQELLEETKKGIYSAENLIMDLLQMSKRLNDDIEKLKSHISILNDGTNELQPIVSRAKMHSDLLNAQSNRLDTLFMDTRNIANQPLKAANAYNTMAEAISNSSILANEALNSAQSAFDQIESQELENKQKSTELFNEATELTKRIESELANPVVKRVDVIDLSVNATEKSHNNIIQELDKLPELASLSTIATQAAEVASNAESLAKTTDEQVNRLNARIDKIMNNAEKTPQDLNDLSSAIRQSQNYINHISTITPNNDRIEEIKTKYEKLKSLRDNVGEKIVDLRRKIELARHQANRIKLGAEFLPNSSLQLHNPEGFTKSATYSRLSLFFRTKDPNGLLAYIGNPKSVQQKRKKRFESEEDDEHKMTNNRKLVSYDYISLEIISGNVVLNLDLGSGVSTPITNKKFVYDGQWHQVIVERIGKSVTLTVKTQGEDDSVAEGSSTGPSSVFNLDQQNSFIFIGGIPSTVVVQPSVQFRHFTGNIEDVMLGETPLGLWNFQSAENVFGAKERDSLVNLTPTDGLRFDGNGYAILSRGRQNFAKETYIRLKFRTFAKEGLLFLIGQDRDYLALEIKDGKVVFLYELGSAPFILTTNETYNDGEWHSINANRYEKEGALTLDGILAVHGEADGKNTELATTDDIFIGGFPKEHPFYEVTQIDFEGCIKELQIGTEQQNLINHKEAVRVTPGCPISVARTASFTDDATGYIAMDTNLDLIRYVQITLKFKSLNPRGLLFYVSNNDHSSYLAIYLNEGTLILRVQPGGIISTDHGVTYNDNQWHYITATITPERLKLDVNDINSFTIENTDGNELRFGDSKIIYYGGVPQDIWSDPRFIKSIPVSFIGCFGDVTVNEKFQNFADSRNRPNATLTSCPLVDRDSQPLISPEQQITDILRSTDKPELILQSTTQVSTTTSTEQPLPIGQCKYSTVPSQDTEVSVDNGIRFGNTHWSRYEFAVNLSVVNNFLYESGFQLEFKTIKEEGVLFYIISDNNIDFVGLYLLEGKVHYGWDCGSGKALISSTQTYNDGEWHKVTFTRSGENGMLSIDASEEISGSSQGVKNSLNVKTPIYIGGLPEHLSRTAKNNLRNGEKVVITSFPGCIRNVYIQAVKHEFNTESIGFDISLCSDQVEDGNFFHSNGGFVKLHDEFRVGSNFIINMEIKPRTLSATLLAVFGGTDFLTLFISDGQLSFRVDNGAGPFNITYNPSSKYYFCDGEWHVIQAIKINNVVTLKVDNIDAGVGLGIGGVSSTDTRDPLYIGGVPEEVRVAKKIEDSFVGCIRIIDINSRKQSFNSAKVYGSVTLNSCSVL